ncbi:MAG: hypothetical protein KC609_10685 [Myxococcales bacterium]|nr:hypothetical protein [Myxococcales bacterium]
MAEPERRERRVFCVCYRASGGMLATIVFDADTRAERDDRIEWYLDGVLRFVVPLAHYETCRTFEFKKEADEFALAYRREQHHLGRRTDDQTARLEERGAASAKAPSRPPSEAAPIIEGVAVQFAGIAPRPTKQRS